MSSHHTFAMEDRAEINRLQRICRKQAEDIKRMEARATRAEAVLKLFAATASEQTLTLPRNWFQTISREALERTKKAE